MRNFTKLSPRIWHSKNFRALTHREQLQYLYFYGGPHQTSAGVFYVSADHACSDLRIDMEEYLTNIHKMRALELIRYDPDHSEVLIEEWFRLNAPDNPKHRIGTVKLIHQIMSDELRSRSLESMEKATADKHARLRSRIQAERRV